MAKREVVLGSIYNERGGQIEAAQIKVDSTDPAFRFTVPATGGAYAIRQVPVGTALTITASAPGYSSRSRAHVVQEVLSGIEHDPNRLDFGGREAGMFYYLSNYPEVMAIDPPNLAKDVKAYPLEVKFTFSHPIRDDSRGNFERLLQVRVPSVDGDKVITVGMAYGVDRATMTWASDNLSATFRFTAPLVARFGEAAATVTVDPTVPVDDWPKSTDGRRLGFDVAGTTQDATSATVRNRVAPFAQPGTLMPRPSALPSPLDLWGLTHATSVRFSLARDLKVPKVLSVEPASDVEGNDDVFIVKFDQPMRGFPEEALSPEVRRQSNYRYVLGNTVNKEDRDAFEAADPSKGTTPTLATTFDSKDPNTVVLHMAKGTFSPYRHFKFYVDPKVENIYGVPLGAPATFQGNL